MTLRDTRKRGSSAWAGADPASIVADTHNIDGILEAVRQGRRMAASIGAVRHGVYLIETGPDGHRPSVCFDAEFPKLSSLSARLASPEGREWLAGLGPSMMPRFWPGPAAAAVRPGLAHPCDALLPDIRGLALPVFAEPGAMGLVLFAGADLDAEDAAICDLHIRAFALFGRVAQLRRTQSGTAPAMSNRELDCLRLTADGNTSGEIAGKLGLSVHTANQYLTVSAQKLNAMNRMHAVAKALRLGLID